MEKGRRFTDAHGFAKPNDERGLKLMDHAAMDLMREYKDVALAFGESDEYRRVPYILSMYMDNLMR